MPNDASVGGVFDQASEHIYGILGAGEAAYQQDGSDGWLGSLDSVSDDSGYWVTLTNDAPQNDDESYDVTLSFTNVDPVSYDDDGEVVYSLRNGNNLVSYPYQTPQSLSSALGSAAGSVFAIVGEGVSALNLGDEFVGSISDFEGTKGYWIVTDLGDDPEATMEFTYTQPTDGNGNALSRTSGTNAVKDVPSEFGYEQSTTQAFFFVESASINGRDMTEDDLLIAYNGDQIVGSRYWNGSMTDVPAMGYDGAESRIGYSAAGDQISFKVLDYITGELVDMAVESGSVEWSNIGISIVSLSDTSLPSAISMGSAYPNPFNPSTMIGYNVPTDMDVNLSVYDIQGRLITELVSGVHTGGSYDVTWNADMHASGLYIVKFVAGGSVETQKIMLVK